MEQLELELSYIAGRNANGHTLEDSLAVSYKVKNTLKIKKSTIPLLGIYLRVMKIQVCTKVYRGCIQNHAKCPNAE